LTAELESARIDPGATIEQKDKVLNLYKKAEAYAVTIGCLHWLALTHELCSKFCHRQNLSQKAKYHLQQSLSCYKTWGATVKVQFLEKMGSS